MSARKDKAGNVIPQFTADAFDRLRTSNPLTLFDDRHIYGLNSVTTDGTGPARWLYVESGGVATYSGSDSSVNLITDTVSGSSVIKRSNRYFPYIPGKSQLFQGTGVLGTTAEGLERRIGILDDNNGIFFLTDSDGVSAGIRSDATGTIVNSSTIQNSWNFDVMDGSNSKRNPSGINLDMDMGQIFVFDLQWLSLGSVRYGLMIDSNLHWCHYAHHANKIAIPYMRTATLPVCYEIKNTATLTDTPTLKSICATLISEGTEAGLSGATFSKGNGATLRDTITVREPVLALRLLNQFQSRDNRISCELIGANFFASDKNTYLEVVQVTNPSSVEGAFTKVASGVSGCEFSVDISSVHGGIEHGVIDDYAPAAGNLASVSKAFNNPALEARDPYNFISQNNDSTESQLFVVYATSIDGTNAKVAASLQWEEIQ